LDPDCKYYQRAGFFGCEGKSIKKLQNRVLLMFLVNHPNKHAESIGNNHWIRISESKLWQSFLGEKDPSTERIAVPGFF